MIRKVKAGWKVVSHTTGKSFGTYRSHAAAVKRLRQIKFYGGKK